MIGEINRDNYINLKEVFDEILIIEKDCFKNQAFDKDNYRELLKNSNLIIYFLKNNDLVLSYVSFIISIDSIDILKIATREEFRRKQNANLLIKNILKLNKDIFIEVRVSNEKAINFYKKNDFQKLNIRKNYYRDNNEDAIIMKRSALNE